MLKQNPNYIYFKKRKLPTRTSQKLHPEKTFSFQCCLFVVPSMRVSAGVRAWDFFASGFVEKISIFSYISNVASAEF
jgi:hypothetical protein